MSQGELVSAYLEGRVSRRTLIRRLVGAGISVGAAVSYAQVLKPERAFAVSKDSDHYPDMSVTIVEEDLDKVLNKGRILVKVHADEDAELDPLRMRAYLKVHDSFTYLGVSENPFNGPANENVPIPLTVAGQDALASRNKAKIQVFWVGFDAQGTLPNGKEVAVLKA